MKLPSFLARPLLLLIALLAPALPAWSNVGGPTLSSPAPNAVCRNTITVTYNLAGPTVIPGTTFITFNQEHITYGYSLSVPASTVGPHSFTFDPTQPELSPELITDGQPHIPGGVYDVKLYGFDANGQQQVVTNLNVTISYAQPPPAPAPGAPTHELRYVKGGLVPLDLTDSQVQENAVWTGFGTPAVNENGQIAFVGKWFAPPSLGTPASQTGAGVWLDNQLLFFVNGGIPNNGGITFKKFSDPVIDRYGRVAFIASIKGLGVTADNDTVIVSNVGGVFHVVAREGDPAPGAGGLTFKSFTGLAVQADPEGVSPPAPTGVGPRLAPIGSTPVVASGGGIYFTAKLNNAPKGTTMGAWWQPTGASAVQLMIRQGDMVPVYGVDPVKTFQLLRAVSGSPAQGRGPVSGQEALVQINFTTGNFQTIARYTPGGVTPVVQTGGSVLTGSVWKKLGSLPTVSADGQKITMLATVANADKSTTKGLFQCTDAGAAPGGASWKLIEYVGADSLTGGPGALFSAFKDPVSSSDDAGVAFLGANAVSGSILKTNNDGVYWLPFPGLPAPMLVAREGSQAPNAPAGAVWASFKSIVLPDGCGPVFTATLLKGPAGTPGPGGITSIDDFGLYGATSTGFVFELLRENQLLPGTSKTVKSFTVLKAASGSPGVQRCFHGHQVVALANFVDKTSGIVVISIP